METKHGSPPQDACHLQAFVAKSLLVGLGRVQPPARVSLPKVVSGSQKMRVDHLDVRLVIVKGSIMIKQYMGVAPSTFPPPHRMLSRHHHGLKQTHV